VSLLQDWFCGKHSRVGNSAYWYFRQQDRLKLSNVIPIRIDNELVQVFMTDTPVAKREDAFIDKPPKVLVTIDFLHWFFLPDCPTLTPTFGAL
jgi:hypothetical protein